MSIQMLDDLKKNGVRSIGGILGILVFMRTMPCYLWSVESILRPICAILILTICLSNISNEKWTKWIFCCIACAYIWATVFVDHSSIVTVFNFLAFACIPIIKRDLIFETYRSFRCIFVFFVALSIINYIMVFIGFDFWGRVIEPLNKLKDYKYMMYPFLVVPMQGTLGRFSSIYDEPGFIGTLAALMLIAERMNLQKRGNVVLLVAGIIAFSFYFYVAMIFGFILFSSKLKHKWVYIGMLFVFVIVTYNNEYLYDTIWSRFEYDAEEGKFAGDNRNGGGLDYAYEAILGTPLFFTGLGSTIAEEYSGAASLKLVILKHGFIFVFLNLLGYFILSLRQILNKKDLIAFFVFFLLTLYQRPGFYGTYSVFMYVMLIYKFGETKYEEYT